MNEISVRTVGNPQSHEDDEGDRHPKQATLHFDLPPSLHQGDVIE